MFAYIATYIGDLVTGATLILVHQAQVRFATQREQKKDRVEEAKLQRRITQMQQVIDDQRDDLNAYEMSKAAADTRR